MSISQLPLMCTKFSPHAAHANPGPPPSRRLCLSRIFGTFENKLKKRWDNFYNRNARFKEWERNYYADPNKKKRRFEKKKVSTKKYKAENKEKVSAQKKVSNATYEAAQKAERDQDPA